MWGRLGSPGALTDGRGLREARAMWGRLGGSFADARTFFLFVGKISRLYICTEAGPCLQAGSTN
jgi:hypothetical protein